MQRSRALVKPAASLARAALPGILLLLVAIAGNCAFAQEGSPIRAKTAEPGQLTLSQAESIALEFNPEILINSYSNAIAKGRFREAKEMLLPKVGAAELFGYSNNQLFVFASRLMQHRFQPSALNFSSLNTPDPIASFFTTAYVRVPILHKFDTWGNISRQKMLMRATLQVGEHTAQNVRYQVIQSYYGALVAGARLKLAQHFVELGEADVVRLKNLYKFGQVVLSDVLAMQVKLAEFRKQLAQARGDLSVALARLNTVLGTPGAARPSLAGNLIDRDFQVESEEALIAQALLRRRDLLQAQSLSEASHHELRQAMGSYLPKIDGYAAVIQSGDAIVNGGTSLIVGGLMALDLFEPGRQAKISQARAAMKMAQAQAELKRNQVRLEIISAREQLIVSGEKLSVTRQSCEQAREALRIVRDRQRVGLTTITELLRAEDALIKAETDLIDARYDNYLALAKVRLASGTLTSLKDFE